MSLLLQKAERAYGPTFVLTSTGVSGRLSIPLDWLLAAICWETGQFASKGPPWPVNKSDGGGGLIGFTPLKGHPAEFKGPVEQLALVEQHYRKWMSTLKIATFQSPEDLYLVVRGPYGIGQPDSFNMGGGLNKGEVLKIYRGYLAKEGISTSATISPVAMPSLPFGVRKGSAKTRGTQVRIRTGPGLNYPTVRFLMFPGTRINVLDQVRGDNVDGNDLWDKIDEGYIADAYVEFEGIWV